MSAPTAPARIALARTEHLPASSIKELVSLACRAPSVHNTQPWTWQVRPDGLRLYADPSRRLTLADPQGRNLTISCGASLHHAQVAALANGWSSSVTHLPDPADPALLATVRLSPVTPPATAAKDLQALLDRCTDRRRFTSWPVPDERLQRLAEVADEWGGQAVALTDVTDRFQVELLVSRALHLQSRDRAVAEEQRSWAHRRSGAEGVPRALIPERSPRDESHRSRFGTGDLDDPIRDVEGGDGLVLLCAEEDTPAAWLRCGEGLSALWLHAVRNGLSVVPLSQLVEVPETRAALQYGVLGGVVVPMLLVRIGWQTIGRSQLEPTPRRPLDEVLLP